MTPTQFQRLGLIFIPWCAGDSRHERLLCCRERAQSKSWAASFLFPDYDDVITHAHAALLAASRKLHSEEFLPLL